MLVCFFFFIHSLTKKHNTNLYRSQTQKSSQLVHNGQLKKSKGCSKSCQPPADQPLLFLMSVCLPAPGTGIFVPVSTNGDAATLLNLAPFSCLEASPHPNPNVLFHSGAAC